MKSNKSTRYYTVLSKLYTLNFLLLTLLISVHKSTLFVSSKCITSKRYILSLGYVDIIRTLDY